MSSRSSFMSTGSFWSFWHLAIDSDIFLCNELILIKFYDYLFMLFLLFFDSHQLSFLFDQSLGLLGDVMIGKLSDYFLGSHWWCVWLSVFVIFEIQFWNVHLFLFFWQFEVIIQWLLERRWLDLHFLVIYLAMLRGFLCFLLYRFYSHDILADVHNQPIHDPNDNSQN